MRIGRAAVNTVAADRLERDVVVVGGGLVGSLLAILLRDRGHAVTVFERGPDRRAGAVPGGRSINLVLTRRGIRALEQVGLGQGALDLTVSVTGRIMHDRNGALAYQPYGRDDTECNYSISRSGLNDYLVRHAAERGVELIWNSRLVGADLEANRLQFAGADGEELVVEAGVVFGADGAGSALRDAFSRLDGFEETSVLLDHGYKELLIPADDAGSFRIEAHALHIWPRTQQMLMALPNHDGSFTATLYLPFEGRDSFAGLTDGGAVRELFLRLFPDAVPLIPDLEQAFFENPTGKLGTVRCRPWNSGGGALLVGDAAHAIVPFFGQGMNSGFEDCTLLDELLRAHPPGAWQAVFDEFNRRRKPDADAIADMALENFDEMRDRVADPAFLLGKHIDHRLEQAMPERYRSRYSMVMYSHIPFAIAQAAGEIQREIRDELARGLGSVDELDLDRARALIDRKLTPFLRDHDVTLDY